MANASGRDEEKRVERGKSLGPVVAGVTGRARGTRERLGARYGSGIKIKGGGHMRRARQKQNDGRAFPDIGDLNTRRREEREYARLYYARFLVPRIFFLFFFHCLSHFETRIGVSRLFILTCSIIPS